MTRKNAAMAKSVDAEIEALGLHCTQRASLLVRCWVEESTESGPIIRGWVKNLHTGRERLFGDPGLVTAILQEETCCPEA